jgi:hypothetical protein
VFGVEVNSSVQDVDVEGPRQIKKNANKWVKI